MHTYTLLCTLYHGCYVQVPGAYELPLAARLLAMSQTVDSIICLGCLIKVSSAHSY
jgi:6,7-dimethyl-8-ribityllumazine synthase